jgi:hypothetical protein
MKMGVEPKESKMSRLRVTITTAALLIALVALTFNSFAQPPGGRGGGGGGRGGPGGGFGGPGGPGGRGGPGGSLLQLAMNPAVQVDLKLKDKQKAQIKSLNDNYDAQMQELRGQMRGPGGQGPGGPQGKGQRGGGGNGDPNAQAGQGGGGGFGGGGFGGGGGGEQGQDPNAQGGGGRGNRGNRGQNGQRPQEDPEVAQQRAMAFEAMNELRQSAEGSLGRILDKGQVGRLKQIDLQRQGPDVIFRPDMIEKLAIDEVQIEMLNEVRSGRREAQQVTRRARGALMKTAFENISQGQPNNGQNGGNDQNGGNGQNGNRRNRGFDPAQRAALEKYMERPEVKAQDDQLKSQEVKITGQYTTAINKVLTARQRALFKKMLGVPFDLAQLGGGNPWGGRGGNRPGNQASAKDASKTGAPTATATAKAGASDDDDDAAPTKATIAAPTTKAKAAAAKRKSLRESRGASSDDN